MNECNSQFFWIQGLIFCINKLRNLICATCTRAPQSKNLPKKISRILFLLNFVNTNGFIDNFPWISETALFSQSFLTRKFYKTRWLFFITEDFTKNTSNHSLANERSFQMSLGLFYIFDKILKDLEDNRHNTTIMSAYSRVVVTLAQCWLINELNEQLIFF